MKFNNINVPPLFLYLNKKAEIQKTGLQGRELCNVASKAGYW